MYTAVTRLAPCSPLCNVQHGKATASDCSALLASKVWSKEDGHTQWSRRACRKAERLSITISTPRVAQANTKNPACTATASAQARRQTQGTRGVGNNWEAIKTLCRALHPATFGGTSKPCYKLLALKGSQQGGLSKCADVGCQSLAMVWTSSQSIQQCHKEFYGSPMNTAGQELNLRAVISTRS